jgi:hypothetical protein
MANGNYTETLRQPGFLAFFWTQFLGAFNDNFLKIVVSFVALESRPPARARTTSS